MKAVIVVEFEVPDDLVYEGPSPIEEMARVLRAAYGAVAPILTFLDQPPLIHAAIREDAEQVLAVFYSPDPSSKDA